LLPSGRERMQKEERELGDEGKGGKEDRIDREEEDI